MLSLQEQGKQSGGDESGESAAEVEEPPVPQPTVRKRRGAVSGAVMTEEDAASYVKKVSSLHLTLN